MLRNKILTLVFLGLICQVFGQDKTFERKANTIAKRIDSITISEKETMKKSLISIEKQLEQKEISFEEAENEKMKTAKFHANRINEAVSLQEIKLQKLIRDKINGKLKPEEEKNWKHYIINGFEDDNYIKDSITGIKTEKRLTTQLVFILGMNQVLNDDKGYYGDGFKTAPFGFSEVGFDLKYKLKKDNVFWNLKFGLNIAFHELRPKSDNDVVVINQNQTYLQDAGFNIKKSKLNIGYFILPVHLEMDFSKPQYNHRTKQHSHYSQKGFRMGLGGFFGIRYDTNQVIIYKENGKRIRKVERDDFNINTFTFGPSAYIGYHDVSIFAKYDINPLFKNNPQNINNFSIGLRLDFN